MDVGVEKRVGGEKGEVEKRVWGGVEKRVEKGEKGRERRGRERERERERGTLMIKRVGGLWMWWREGGFLSVRLGATGARAAHQCRVPR